MAALLDPARVCAVVLAGGQASRMGGLDKGLQTLHDRPLVAHALDRLRRQRGGAPGYIAINANRNLEIYGQWCDHVWPDTLPGFPGPLGGFLTALERCLEPAYSRAEFVLTVPCDTPLFPLDLLERMGAALLHSQTDLAIAQAPDHSAEGPTVLRNQAVFCLMRTSVLPSLQRFMATGERKIGAWALAEHHVRVPFDRPQDMSNAFANANTLDQLHRLELE